MLLTLLRLVVRLLRLARRLPPHTWQLQLQQPTDRLVATSETLRHRCQCHTVCQRRVAILAHLCPLIVLEPLHPPWLTMFQALAVKQPLQPWLTGQAVLASKTAQLCLHCRFKAMPARNRSRGSCCLPLLQLFQLRCLLPAPLSMPSTATPTLPMMTSFRMPLALWSRLHLAALSLDHPRGLLLEPGSMCRQP